eukprot:gene14202-biopygen3577
MAGISRGPRMGAGSACRQVIEVRSSRQGPAFRRCCRMARMSPTHRASTLCTQVGAGSAGRQVIEVRSNRQGPVSS